MPCPYFQPTQAAEQPRHPGARLPLIHEFDGLCRAGLEPRSAPEALRFHGCNRGYSRSLCPHFPAGDSRSCIRFSAVGQTTDILEVLCIEEVEHTPVFWQAVHYSFETASVTEPLDICLRAQVEAFSRSYLAAHRDE